MKTYTEVIFSVKLYNSFTCYALWEYGLTSVALNLHSL